MGSYEIQNPELSESQDMWKLIKKFKNIKRQQFWRQKVFFNHIFVTENIELLNYG